MYSAMSGIHVYIADLHVSHPIVNLPVVSWVKFAMVVQMPSASQCPLGLCFRWRAPSIWTLQLELVVTHFLGG